MRSSLPSPTSTISSARRSRAGSRPRSRRTSTSGTRRASSRASSIRGPPSSASSASSTPRSSAARAATTSTTRSGRKRWPPQGREAASARASGPHGHRDSAVWKFGTPDQHERFLAPRSPVRRSARSGITEPGAGSDVPGIRTRADKTPDGYRVNGAKTFITNGVRADFVVTAVKTTPEGGHGGISFLLIEKGMPGFEVTRKLEKMGWQASDPASRVHRRRGDRPRTCSALKRRLLPDHGQLPVGAPPHGARRGGRDAPPLRSRSPTRSSARHSAGRSAASRSCATRSPRSA